MQNGGTKSKRQKKRDQQAPDRKKQLMQREKYGRREGRGEGEKEGKREKGGRGQKEKQLAVPQRKPINPPVVDRWEKNRKNSRKPLQLTTDHTEKTKQHTKQPVSENVSTCVSRATTSGTIRTSETIIHYRPVQRTDQVTKLHNIIEPEKR